MRVDSETPSFAAITLVAPGVRFNFFAILTTPDFALAIVFIVRTSSFVHARRTTLLAFAIVSPNRILAELALLSRAFNQQPMKALSLRKCEYELIREKLLLGVIQLTIVCRANWHACLISLGHADG